MNSPEQTNFTQALNKIAQTIREQGLEDNSTPMDLMVTDWVDPSG